MCDFIWKLNSFLNLNSTKIRKSAYLHIVQKKICFIRILWYTTSSKKNKRSSTIYRTNVRR